MSWAKHPPANTPARRARTKQYNSTEYKRARQAVKQHVDTGRARCWRCGRPIDPRKPWHLGHDDNNRNVIRGPEHPACNLTAAARKANRVAKHKAANKTQPVKGNWSL